MDKKLGKPSRSTTNTTTTTTTTTSPAKTTGLGKGRPGIPRKEQVSKRQERRREQQNEKRKATTPPSTPKKIAPRAKSSQSTPTIEPRNDETNLLPSTPPNQPGPSPPRPQPPQEVKRQLDAQFSRKSKEKRLALVQALGKAVRDEPPNQRELELFWEDMDLWGNLDARVVTALVQVWNDISKHPGNHRRQPFLRQLIHLQALSNGVKNCVEHFTGAMVGQAYRDSKDDNVQTTLETMQLDLQSLRHSEYTETLRSCACTSCSAVLEFDERYERYNYVFSLFLFP